VEVLALTTRGTSPRSCALKRDVSCCHSLVAAFSLANAPSCTPKPGSDRHALASVGEAWGLAGADVPEALSGVVAGKVDADAVGNGCADG
jgi:hypothetical protein